MKKVVIKFIDQEIGDELVTVEYDEKKSDFFSAMNLAKEILYLDFEFSSYEELKEECPVLTRKLYDIAMECLEGGLAGVTTERFCKFMEAAFGWKYEMAKADIEFNVEYGYWPK